MAKSTKQVFLKPGQKYATPPKNDSLYKFYTSLFKQKKNASPMALKWCYEHGVFSKKTATDIELMLKMKKLTI